MSVRVLFTSFPVNTHFFNSVPLAWALQTAGHDVRVASGPELTEAITQSGLTAVQAGSAEPLQRKLLRITAERASRAMRQWREASDAPFADPSADLDCLSWEQLTAIYDTFAMVMGTLNDSMIDDLVRFARLWRPDLVVWDSLSYAGAVAATATGAAHGRMLYMHDVEGRLRHHFVGMKAGRPPDDRGDSVERWLAGWAGRYGCGFSEQMVTGHFTIDQHPDSFRLGSVLRRLPMRYVPYNGPAVVPDWLWGPPPAPRVLMTFGLSLKKWTHLQVMSPALVQETLDAMAGLDIELVATLPLEFLKHVTRVPGNTRVVDFVPLHAILPSCSAVIHHGGGPGFNGALLYGVPQLLISMASDTVPKSRRLHQTGAGLTIAPPEATGAKVRKAVQRLLGDPSFRAGADRARAEILAQPSPDELVPELERLAAEHRRGAGTTAFAAQV